MNSLKRAPFAIKNQRPDKRLSRSWRSLVAPKLPPKGDSRTPTDLLIFSADRATIYAA